MQQATTAIRAQEATAMSRKQRLQLIFIIGALSAFGPLSLDMYLPALPSLSLDLGGTASQAQLTLTACLLGLAGGQLIAGPLSDATGRRKPLLVGLIGYTVASFLCALSPSIPILIVLRFIQGAAGAAGIVIARAVVRDLFSGAEIARFFSLTMIINGLAPILAPVIGGQLLNFTNWRGVFILLTVIGLGLVALGAFGLRESLPPERRRTGGVRDTLDAFRTLLRDRVFMGYALSSGLAFAAMFSYIAGSPFVVEDIYGVSPQWFSLIFATNALGIVVTGQISGRLIGRVSPRRLLRLGLTIALLAAALLFVAVLLNVGLVGILPAFFLLVSSIGLIAPNSTALALADHPRIAGSASAFLGVFQYIIGALATPLVGIAGSGTAVPLASIILAVTVGANVIFILLTNTPAHEEATAVRKPS